MQYLASSRQYKGNCWGPFFFFLSSCFNLCFLSAVICFVSLWWIPSSKSKNIIQRFLCFIQCFPSTLLKWVSSENKPDDKSTRSACISISVCKNQQLSPILPGLYFPWYSFFQTDGFSLYILIKTFPHPHRWHHPHLVENNLKWECKTGCIQWHSSTH